MMNRNIFNSDMTLDIILSEEWQSLHVEYHREGIRVIGYKENMIKAEVFSAKDNTKFRVRMLIESISDNDERLLWSMKNIGTESENV